jgi:hypothetical protein
MSGKIPKDGGSEVGYHSLPKIKSSGETILNIGKPSRKREKTIRPRTTMETRANVNKIYLIIFSFVRLVIFFPLKGKPHKANIRHEYFFISYCCCHF